MGDRGPLIAVLVTICIYVYTGEQKDLPQRHFGDVQLHQRDIEGTCWILTQPANTTLTEVYIQTFENGLSTNTGFVTIDITTSVGEIVLSGGSFLAVGKAIGSHTAVKFPVTVDNGFLRSFFLQGPIVNYLGTSLERTLHVNITNINNPLGGPSPRVGLDDSSFRLINF